VVLGGRSACRDPCLCATKGIARVSLNWLNACRSVWSVRAGRRGATLSGVRSLGAYNACGWERSSALYIEASSWLYVWAVHWSILYSQVGLGASWELLESGGN
jgi:hypothetical protein